MTDVFTKQKRSEVMSRIKSRGNKDTELKMIQILRKHRISGWRRKQDIFGKPDFVFPKQKVALFVDGCFWHGCPRHGHIPKSNQVFWEKKLQRNKMRDRYVSSMLKRAGWQVIRVWEHDLSRPTYFSKRIQNALLVIKCT